MIRSITLHIPSFAALALCLGACTTTAWSQATPAVSSAAPPADVAKSLSELADLDLLIAVTPLNLNKAQIDALLAVLESIDKGASDLDAKNNETLRGVAEDIDKARAAGLKGTPPDSDAQNRIGKALDEIDKRGKDAHAANARRLVVAAEQNLMPEQIKLIETQYAKWIGGKIPVPAKYRDDPDGRKAYVEESALGEYVERILMTQRVIDLLKKLRETALDPPAQPAPATAPPASVPPPAPPAANP